MKLEKFRKQLALIVSIITLLVGFLVVFRFKNKIHYFVDFKIARFKGFYLTFINCSNYPDKSKINNILSRNIDEFTILLEDVDKIAQTYVDCNTFPKEVCKSLRSRLPELVKLRDYYISVSLRNIMPIKCDNNIQKTVLEFTVASDKQAKQILKLLNGDYKTGTQNFHGIPVEIINN